jgi:hypothetical protein
MTEWNHILLRPEYALEEPDEILVKAVKLLRKRTALKVLDLAVAPVGTLSTWLRKHSKPMV